MVAPLKIWVFCASLFFALANVRGFEPEFIPVEGLPSGIRQYRGALETGHGWIFCSSEGIVHKSLIGWEISRKPGGGEINLAVPFAHGLAVAGDGFCYLYKNGIWRDVGLDDVFLSGAESNAEAVLAGLKGVYLIRRTGTAERLFENRPLEVAYVHKLDGEVYAFAGSAGVLKWNGAKLVVAPDALNLDPKNSILAVESTGSGFVTIVSSRRIFGVDRNRVRVFLPTVVENLAPQGMLNAAVFGNELVVASMFGGISAYGLTDDALLWNRSTDRLGGNLYFARQYEAGLLVGSSSGLYVLPDPTIYAYHSSSPGDVRISGGTSQAVFVGSGKQAEVLEGEAPGMGEEVMSVAELPSAKLVIGHWGRIDFAGKNIPLRGREVYQLAVLTENRVATLQPGIVNLVDADGHLQVVPFSSTPTSIGAARNGLLVGTGSGVYRLSHDGKVEERFGVGFSAVHSAGDQFVAVDSTNQVYDAEGKRLGEAPFSELLDIVKWKGGLVILAKFPDGRTWAGSLELPGLKFIPFDLPMPPSSVRLASRGENLYVVAPGKVLRVQLASPYLGPKNLPSLADAEGFPVQQGRLELLKDKSGADVLMPASRLGWWPNASYAIQVEEGGWESAGLDSPVRIPRIRYGENKISVRARWANHEQVTDLWVVRPWPWWARAPAIALYIVALAGLGYGGVRWRTNQLHRRAIELESLITLRTSELRKAQKAREEFFSILSHEIRNPLNGVVGICEILSEAPEAAVAPRERMYVRTLRDCSEQLRSMLDDVLDFSRIDRGDIQMNEETFELGRAIRGAVLAVDVMMENCALVLPEARIWLRADCGKIRQVVMNLVSNALKYGVPPKAQIIVETTFDPGGDCQVAVSVKNTGPAIPPEEIARIFEGFARGEDALRRRIPGSGLGLAVSRRIARAMGGDLTVSSDKGLTAFTLKVRAPVTQPADRSFSAPPMKNVSRALAIEDEAYNRLVLGHLLSQLGYEVDWAGDGATAMEYVLSGTYDLILTDVMLPDTTGIELAAKILAVIPSPKPPIVAVTAYSTPEKVAEARAAGITGFVTKPISKEKLEAAIVSSVPLIPISRRPEIGEDVGRFDFEPILRLQNGRQVLAEFAESLPEVWGEVIVLLQQGDVARPEVIRAVHAFRSRVLAVSAAGVAEQLAVLEDSVRNGATEDAQRVASIIGPMIESVAGSAQRKAYS